MLFISYIIYSSSRTGVFYGFSMAQVPSILARELKKIVGCGSMGFIHLRVILVVIG